MLTQPRPNIAFRYRRRTDVERYIIGIQRWKSPQTRLTDTHGRVFFCAPDAPQSDENNVA